ncbi:aminotransferase class I/II-fold pyridoxal phosphate-dependent enzyme [Pseudoduganella sp. OTU4001]|uniref:aminotransferase class I/II-fold pyridoxal phosphate-dependent enzyme n=1 Tax=Pseudoduganella sp. OTU4001 TaxID=3043854 RepID=UPI00313F364C
MGNSTVSNLDDNASAAAAPVPAWPPAQLPTSPVLSLASFGHASAPAVPSILDAPERRYVTSGRVAIALALRQAGVQPGDAVLVPAYHCASMVEPVIWAGATPVFYRIKADTAVDLDDVAGKLDGRCKLLMATNYFGFPQDLPALRAFCDAHGLQLLEDCAHAFLGSVGGRPLGSWGDYAIASSMKFFPLYEGGCLVSARHPLATVQLQSAGAGFEIKSMLNTLESGWGYGRMPVLRALSWAPLQLKAVLWRLLKARRRADAAPLAPGSSDGGFSFDPRWLDKRSSLMSRLMLRLVSRRRMGALRRRHYQQLQNALGQLPGCQPLFAQLPDGVYPWVFPLKVEQPQALFRTLKSRGVPVVRFGEFLWPGVDASVCANSVTLSRQVLQLPCHQELRASELAWMIAQVRSAVEASAA